MRLTLAVVSLLTAVSIAGCASDPTALRADQDAVAAAAEFQRLADDAFAAGADPDVVSAYRDIGGAVMRNGRVSPVTILIDGTPHEFLATARQMEMDGGPTCSQPGSLCLMAPPLRTLLAWQRSDPRRVVQLTASAGTTEIGRAIPGMVDAGYFGRGTLIYFDGAHGVYVGTSGTLTIGDPLVSDEPCSTVPPLPSPSSVPELAQCRRAEFTASFTGALDPAPVPVRGNTASGTHTISMASQSVRGARLVLPSAPLCADCDGPYPRELMPPIVLRGEALPATLGVSATASLVTFTLRVTNPRAEPATLKFSSGQQYDFRVRGMDGSIQWSWSADKLFTAALTERTLASGETVTYTGTWDLPIRGTFLGEGRLTSSSHRAVAGAMFTVP
jgi:hypothetical protein